MILLERLVDGNLNFQHQDKRDNYHHLFMHNQKRLCYGRNRNKNKNAIQFKYKHYGNR